MGVTPSRPATARMLTAARPSCSASLRVASRIVSRESVILRQATIRCIYTVYMKVLLTDGSGLTSRQVATQLSSAGHVVEVVSPTRLGLCGFTRHVRRVHPVPAFGRDPSGWLSATLEVLARGEFDLL